MSKTSTQQARLKRRPSGVKRRQRYRGELVKICADGYGFIHIADGLPEYFIHRNQVEPKHWIEGQIFDFHVAPPKPRLDGKHAAPRAIDVAAVHKSQIGEKQGRRSGAEEAAAMQP